jgi:hypothetical protein
MDGSPFYGCKYSGGGWPPGLPVGRQADVPFQIGDWSNVKSFLIGHAAGIGTRRRPVRIEGLPAAMESNESTMSER